MMNGDRKEGICRLNVDGNGCDYLRILSDLETKLRNNTNPKEKIGSVSIVGVELSKK